jgi:hypothetical protein
MSNTKRKQLHNTKDERNIPCLEKTNKKKKLQKEQSQSKKNQDDDHFLQQQRSSAIHLSFISKAIDVNEKLLSGALDVGNSFLSTTNTESFQNLRLRICDVMTIDDSFHLVIVCSPKPNFHRTDEKNSQKQKNKEQRIGLVTRIERENRNREFEVVHLTSKEQKHTKKESIMSCECQRAFGVSRVPLNQIGLAVLCESIHDSKLVARSLKSFCSENNTDRNHEDPLQQDPTLRQWQTVKDIMHRSSRRKCAYVGPCICKCLWDLDPDQNSACDHAVIYFRLMITDDPLKQCHPHCHQHWCIEYHTSITDVVQHLASRPTFENVFEHSFDQDFSLLTSGLGILPGGIILQTVKNEVEEDSMDFIEREGGKETQRLIEEETQTKDSEKQAWSLMNSIKITPTFVFQGLDIMVKTRSNFVRQVLREELSHMGNLFNYLGVVRAAPEFLVGHQIPLKNKSPRKTLKKTHTPRMEWILCDHDLNVRRLTDIEVVKLISLSMTNGTSV